MVSGEGPAPHNLWFYPRSSSSDGLNCRLAFQLLTHTILVHAMPECLRETTELTLTSDSAPAVFDRLTRTDLPARTPVLFDTACVLGGSIAGLLAARVLADHARAVLIIERDVVNTEGRSRAGGPQDRHGHALVPGGRAQIERWLPGITREAQDLGGVLVGPEQQAVYLGVC